MRRLAGTSSNPFFSGGPQILFLAGGRRRGPRALARAHYHTHEPAIANVVVNPNAPAAAAGGGGGGVSAYLACPSCAWHLRHTVIVVTFTGAAQPLQDTVADFSLSPSRRLQPRSPLQAPLRHGSWSRVREAESRAARSEARATPRASRFASVAHARRWWRLARQGGEGAAGHRGKPIVGAEGGKLPGEEKRA